MLSLEPPITLSRLTAVAARLAPVIAVGAFGALAFTTTGSHGAVVPTAAAAGDVFATGMHRGVASERAVVEETRHDVARPVPHTVAPVAAKPAQHAEQWRAAPTRHRIRPFIPSGTGMWIYQWGHTSGGDAGRIVARARHVGLSTLYLRTGSSHDGFTAGRHLPALLRATRHTAIRVVAWDFPTLRRPARDAHRLAHAAWLGRHGAQPHLAAVAPDIETPAEGTLNAAWRVRTYLHVLRRHLPKGVTILTTVPWPSSYRLGDYPYRTVAQHSDVLVPMAYWYDNPPGRVTARSIHYLRRFHKPVEPVGQGYDGKLDVPSLRHNNLAREVPVFFRTAHQKGVRGVSIWSWQSAPPATWRALARAHHLFTGRH